MRMCRLAEAYVGAWTNDAVEPISTDDLRTAAGEDLTRRHQYALFTAFRARDVEIVGEEGSFVSEFGGDRPYKVPVDTEFGVA